MTDWKQKLAMGIATAFAAASLTGRMKESEMAFAMAPAKVPTTYLMLTSMRVLVMAPVRVACDGSEVIFFKIRSWNLRWLLATATAKCVAMRGM